eukprot:gene10579-biopygen19817
MFVLMGGCMHPCPRGGTQDGTWSAQMIDVRSNRQGPAFQPDTVLEMCFLTLDGVLRLPGTIVATWYSMVIVMAFRENDQNISSVMFILRPPKPACRPPARRGRQSGGPPSTRTKRN